MNASGQRPSSNRQTAPQPDLLLHTRLFVPPAPAGLVERMRLISRLEQGLQQKLTLITAPAGFGKTTLLSSWRATSAGADRPLAWVSLADGDSEPRRFSSYLKAALDRVKPGVGADAFAMLFTPEPSAANTERALTELINALGEISTDFVLALDDYDLIHNADIHDAVSFLLEHMPPRMHVVISTAEVPPLPLPRLRARGQLVEINASELRFTQEEASQFLNGSMDLDLSASQIAAIESRTEGWITGLQLAALSLKGRVSNLDGAATVTGGEPAPDVTQTDILIGSERFVGDYLATEVLHKQPEAVQDFLLKSSILDRFTASLCDAITGETNSTLMLEMLEKNNLFIVPLDQERIWYRYHYLFGEFLRAHLERDALAAQDDLSDLHRRAADWYEDAGMVGDAIKHWIASGDNIRAAELIVTSAQAMFMIGDVATVLSWFEAVPPEVVLALPRLGLTRAWALAQAHRITEAELGLRDVERTLAVAAALGEPTGMAPAIDEASEDRLEDLLSYADWQELPAILGAISARLAAFRGEAGQVIEISHRVLSTLPVDSYFLRSEIGLSLSFAYLDMADLAAAEQALDEALETCRAAGNIRGLMFAVRTLGAIYVMRGQLRRAAALYTDRLETQARTPSVIQPFSPSIGFVYGSLSRVLLERNDLDGALEQANRGVELGKQTGDGMMLLHSYVALALAYQARGEWDAALESAEKLYNLNPTRYNAAVGARILLGADNVAAASAWARSVELELSTEPQFATEYERLTVARVLYAEGRTDSARELLESLLAQADEARRWGSALEIRVWLALCLMSQSDRDEAVSMITPALELAEAEGYVRAFIKPGPDMIDLLRAVLDSAFSPETLATSAANRLLAVLAATAPLVDEQPALSDAGNLALPEPLSEREVEVLQLIEEGFSNEEIARRLVVTVGTVKTHLSNVYGKLDVHSRTQALARARSLDLL